MPENKIKEIFSNKLGRALIERYGKLPSSAFVAKEFNHRAASEDHINQESARKWLRGLAIPELNKLFVMQAWLGLDLNALNVQHADPSVKNTSEPDKGNFVNKKLFLKQTSLLKKALQNTMDELSDLEKKISNEITNE
jgi:2-hydroxychromene-2-carboxylate isomerase